jgi:hypothetical protein
LRKLSGIWEKESKNYAFILRENYEILRMLIDACLYFDRVSISNHQCSNAYLCKNHADLEFDWEILETMRILRNAVNYEGKRIDSEQWNKLKLQFEIYISALRKVVEDKLKE